MPTNATVIEGTYRDSVELLRIASEIQSAYGLVDAQALMATPANRQRITNTDGFDAEKLGNLDSNDLLLTVEGPEPALEAALDDMRTRLETNSRETEQSAARRAPRTVAAATDDAEPSVALISVPGEYATREAWKALHSGLHVQLFSDNVPLKAERELKLEGRERELLVMGPDCGSTIIDGVPLGFANVVADGPVGLVSASGTGLQEVSVLVDRLGSGISHALGVGGRDLSDAVGAIATCQALALLDADESTEVIVLLSKPPSETATQSVLDAVEACSTPVVACLLGTDDDLPDVEAAATLTDAALRAVETVTDGGLLPSLSVGPEFREKAVAVVSGFGSERRAIRGLFVGGTLCTEAAVLLSRHVERISSNVGIGEPISDPLDPVGHAMVDFGVDELTTGRTHPMIDPTLRTEQLKQGLEDESVAVVLLDIVLGHGSHLDPAAEVAAVVEACSDPPLVIAAVCGTDADPQTRREQVSTLEAAGIYVAASNATAATAAATVLEQAASGSEAQ